MASSSTNNLTHFSGKTLIAINGSQLPLKLNSQNHPTWRAQITPLLCGHNLMGYVTGANTSPPATIEKDGQQVSNPNYEFWDCQDQLILAAIIASIFFSIMNTIADAKSSAEAWTKLQMAFANKSATRILSLRDKLSRAKRDSRSVAEYLQLIKSIAEELSLCGSPVTDVDLVVYVLSGVGPEFRDIAAAIHARDTIISFDELQDKLLAHELYLKRADPTFDTTPITANNVRKGTNTRSSYQQKQGNLGKTNQYFPYENANTSVPANFSSYKSQNSAPRQHSRGTGSQAKVQCQFCDKFGHHVKQCYRARDYFRDLLSQNPQAHYTNMNSGSDQQWFLDTGASHHITNDLSNLSLHSPYDGRDELHQTDGSGLSISHVGSGTISLPSTEFHISNVLCVPSAKTNLIYVSQFCTSNQVSIEFFSDYFLVKDQFTGEIQFKGPLDQSLYKFLSSAVSNKPVCFSIRLSSESWHQRLGHPNARIFNFILSKF